jgi:hypothetical protein
MATFQIVLENANGPIGPHNIANEGVDWEVLGGTYTCKFGECKNLLQPNGFCRHVDKDHFFIMQASRSSCHSTREEGPRHHDHTTMNVRILGNPYKLHKRNEVKAMDHAKKKATTKFDKLQIEAQCVLEVCKPILVRLMGSIVHKILGIKTWGVGLLANTTVSILEKDDDLVALIKNNKMAYAKKMCTTWDPKCKKHRPSKARQKKNASNYLLP